MINKELALNLLNDGLTYEQIGKQLNISKWTVLYHCSPNRRKKSYLNSKKWQEKNQLVVKIASFYRGNRRSKLRPKIIKFTIRELKEKIGPNPKCYLTGKPIDLNEPDSYSLDHRVPVSKGGISSLENCELTSSAVNFAKSDKTVEEFRALCLAVCDYYFGDIRLRSGDFGLQDQCVTD